MGGPELIDYNGERVIRNTLTKELCDTKHLTLEGSTYMYVINNAFAKGKDVIILAGEGKGGPKNNAKKLAGYMI